MTSSSRCLVRKRKLSNGTTILQQDNPFSKAFCMGIWIDAGSRDEGQGEEGLSHFLEHMLFKGTSQRSAFQISQAVENVGGTLDAFTTKEQICIYALVLENHWNLAVDVLSDMFMNSNFPPDQMRLEKQVVLDEIRDAMDAPDDLIHELFTASIFPGHPLGKPILGRRTSVANFSRKMLTSFTKRIFRSESVFISVYGNVDIREITDACGRLLKFAKGKAARIDSKLPRRVLQRKFVKRKLHQQHICIGSRGFSYHERKRFPLMVLTNLLGGGMSSRLFQKIREEMGLAYNIFTYSDHVRDAGLVGTYMSVKPINAGAAVHSVLKEFNKIIRGELKPGELEAAREYIKGRILLGLETAAAKMMRMARNEIYFGRQVSERELIDRIDGVTRDDLIEVASQLLDPEALTIVSMGPSSAGLSTSVPG
jgi:predicted Zn-dependent peptidase